MAITYKQAQAGIEIGKGVYDVYNAFQTNNTTLKTIEVNKESFLDALQHDEEALLIEYTNATRKVKNEAQRFANQVASVFFSMGVQGSSVEASMLQREADLRLETEQEYQRAYDNNKKAIEKQRETGTKLYDLQSQEADNKEETGIIGGFLEVVSGVVNWFFNTDDSDSSSSSTKPSFGTTSGFTSATPGFTAQSVNKERHDKDMMIYNLNTSVSKKNFINAGQTSVDLLHQQIENNFASDTGFYSYLNTINSDPFNFSEL